MMKQNSFEKGSEKVKVAGFKGGKTNVVNLAAEWAKRGVIAANQKDQKGQ